jgi:hypothetical protein
VKRGAQIQRCANETDKVEGKTLPKTRFHNLQSLFIMKTTASKIILALAASVLFVANVNAGRWITRDPIGFMERDLKPAPTPAVATPNLYTFVDNNPINEFDPFGLSGTLTINAINGGGSSGLVSGSLFGTGGGGGHAWITYTPDGGTTTSYGTYGNNPGGQPNGLVLNWETQLGYPSPDETLSTHLNDAQEQNLLNLINQYKQQGQNAWGYTHPCTAFANDAWNAGTGQNFNLGLLNLPSTLGSGIQNYLNAPISASVPPTTYYNVNTPVLFLPR